MTTAYLCMAHRTLAHRRQLLLLGQEVPYGNPSLQPLAELHIEDERKARSVNPYSTALHAMLTIGHLANRCSPPAKGFVDKARYGHEEDG